MQFGVAWPELPESHLLTSVADPSHADVADWGKNVMLQKWGWTGGGKRNKLNHFKSQRVVIKMN